MSMQPWSWLYAICFLDLLGASMIMPVFSAHLRSLGFSHVDIGVLSSLYGAMQLLTGPIIGSWSDINGRKSILSLSLFICSIAYGFMGIASSFYFFLIIRCILGIFKHTQSLCRAFIADVVPVIRQSSVHGLMNAFTSFSFTIGPVVSGHVMELMNGFQYLTSAVMLIFLLNTGVVVLFANTNDNVKTIEEKPSFTNKISQVFIELYSIDWRSFWALFSVKFLFALSGILFFQNMGVILSENFEISSRSMGYTISFYGFVSGLCNLSIGKIKTLNFVPQSQIKSLVYTFFIMSVTFCLLYFTNNFIFFVLCLVPLSASHALSRILLTEVVLQQSDADCRGSVVGASSSISAIARILAPFLSGLIISWGGVGFALLASSVIVAGACFLTVIFSIQLHNKIL